MPATILLLAAGLFSWTGMVPSPASCRLLPFVTIFCCYAVFSSADVDAVFSFKAFTHTLVVYADCCVLYLPDRNNL